MFPVEIRKSEGIVALSLSLVPIGRAEQSLDLRFFQIGHQGRGRLFEAEAADLLAPFHVFGTVSADEARPRPQSRQPLVERGGTAVARLPQVL